ncbi:hypothetical protein HDU93_004927, partial [Gonapodya sp. JEL0774]
MDGDAARVDAMDTDTAAPVTSKRARSEDSHRSQSREDRRDSQKRPRKVSRSPSSGGGRYRDSYYPDRDGYGRRDEFDERAP